jgi:hypothetical protein
VGSANATTAALGAGRNLEVIFFADILRQLPDSTRERLVSSRSRASQ